MKMKSFNWMQSNTSAQEENSGPSVRSAYEHIYVHPCVINNLPHIVYPKGLQAQAPALFTQLSQYYSGQGYALKEDSRVHTDGNNPRQERRHWAPMLLFTASLLFESSAHADIEVDIHDVAAQQHQQIELQLVSNQKIRDQIEQHFAPISTDKPIVTTTITSELATRIFGILHSHYKKQTTDPDHITDDLKAIANYYREFPEVTAMLLSLEKKNWQLAYDENNWVTVASGNIFQVEKAVIHFNTRSAAQLRLNNGCQQNPVCIASPADALLHELLHTHTMLVNTSEFIAQGGMGHVMYPYKHEYAVIDAERKLYASMSQRDDIKRPQRHDHTGHLVKAHCPTCIK
jgi:hypothetical protein